MDPEKREYRKIDFSKITFSEKIRTIEECLCEIEPILWNKDVLDGSLELASLMRNDTLKRE